MERKIFYSSPPEKEVAEILTDMKIEFVHEGEIRKPRLDFYLPECDIYIEVKHSQSDRTQTQIASKRNVILIQGEKSIQFIKLIFEIKSPAVNGTKK